MQSRFTRLVMTALRLRTRGVAVWAACGVVAEAHQLTALETQVLRRAVLRAGGEIAT